MATQESSQKAVSSVAVAVPLPLPTTYTFSVPDVLAAFIKPGVRVLVPFQGRQLVGYVTVLNPPQSKSYKLKSIKAVVDAETPTFDETMVEFLLWVARYYQAPVGEVFRGAHPSGTNAKSVPAVQLIDAEVPALPGLYPAKLTTLLQALRANRGILPISELPETLTPAELKKWSALGVIKKAIVLREARVSRRTEKQWFSQITPVTAPRGKGGRMLKRDLLHQIISNHGPIRQSELRQFPEYRSTALRQIEDEGLVASTTVPLQPELFSAPPPKRDEPPVLNDEQRAAVDRIAPLEHFEGFLLRGVTGSGKTEVYLGVIEQMLARGRGALVLVPEIALTPQLVSRFRARLGDQISVLHSAMTDQQRLAHWSRLRHGEVKLAIGARSAIFAPVHNLGVIIVDEEHDGSFKQNDGVRYHGRDLAIMRAFREKCPIVLGSATPSMESLNNVENHKLNRIDLTQRATGGRLPEVTLVDLRKAKKLKGSPLSQPLIDQIAHTLKQGEQTIVFLNRRGFSTFALCEACGHVIECDDCSISMTWHKQKGRLSCHYCDAARSLPNQCPACSAKGLTTLGAGTEKIEDTLQSLFPNASIDRLDRDTASGKGLTEILERMRSRKTDILVGTQMVTKGHDFPFVTLVCVLDADAGLKLPDFRAAERTVQLLTQVAGRAGRAERPGTVLIQTYDPSHHALRSLRTHDHEGFMEKESETRALFGYPPYAHGVVIRAQGADPKAVEACLKSCAAILKAHQEDEKPIRLRGPAPAIIERVRGNVRWALLATHTDRSSLHKAVESMRAKVVVPNGIRLIADVDPIDLM